jgi:hypothetical protein
MEVRRTRQLATETMDMQQLAMKVIHKQRFPMEVKCIQLRTMAFVQPRLAVV